MGDKSAGSPGDTHPGPSQDTGGQPLDDSDGVPAADTRGQSAHDKGGQSAHDKGGPSTGDKAGDARAGPSDDRDEAAVDDLQRLYLQRYDELRLIPREYRNSTCKPENAHRSPCLEPTCKSTFPSPKKRLQTILDTQLPVSPEHEKMIHSLADQSKAADVIFVTAASANHFKETEGMVRGLREKVFPFLKQYSGYSYHLVYYDLGMEAEQAEIVRKHCQCSFIKFPFEKFPPTFPRYLGSAAWKAVVIKSHVRRSKFLVWMDASVRFRTGNISNILKQADDTGIYITKTPWNLPTHIAQPMFDYFKVEPCLLSPFYELATGFLVFKNDPLVVRAVLDPLNACAFSRNCMCPGDRCQIYKGSCNNISLPFSRCHRFDQSGLAVILYTLFDYRTSSLVGGDYARFFNFNRTDKTPYFPRK